MATGMSNKESQLKTTFGLRVAYFRLFKVRAQLVPQRSAGLVAWELSHVVRSEFIMITSIHIIAMNNGHSLMEIRALANIHS